MVMLAYYKNKSITKNELLKVIEKSYLTSNVYIDTAIKKGFFRIIRNEKDKRSIFILPSVITIKTFEGFIDRRDILYKGNLMKNIYTWSAQPAKRTLTVADLKSAKGKKKFTQVTANT